jgi:phage baseplate assembly protein W
MNILSMQGISTDKVINAQGQIGVVSQHEKLQQDIKTLLLTRKGSVIGNPEYGSNLYKYLFELSSDTNLVLINTEVESVLLDNYNFITSAEIESKIESTYLYLKIDYYTINTNLSTRLEYKIPLNTEGGIDYGS